MSTAINVICLDRPGMLRDIAGAVAKRGGNIVYTQQFVVERGMNRGKASVYMEIDCPAGDVHEMVEELASFDSIFEVSRHEPFGKIFGSRVIIIGGGAQVAQVAVGAVSEADRHNLRGERISVDTIPLVGEDAIADAVSAVSRLPRATILAPRTLPRRQVLAKKPSASWRGWKHSPSWLPAWLVTAAALKPGRTA